MVNRQIVVNIIAEITEITLKCGYLRVKFETGKWKRGNKW